MHAHARSTLGGTRGATGLGALGRSGLHKCLSIGILTGEPRWGKFPMPVSDEL